MERWSSVHEHGMCARWSSKRQGPPVTSQLVQVTGLWKEHPQNCLWRREAGWRMNSMPRCAMDGITQTASSVLHSVASLYVMEQEDVSFSSLLFQSCLPCQQ